MGQRVGLSNGDIDVLNAAYGCDRDRYGMTQGVHVDALRYLGIPNQR